MARDFAWVVSIHDVMPETLPRVRALLARVERAGLAPATLLVVPGRDWSGADLDALRGMAARGHELAGHGWSHRVERFGSLRHRLHGLLLSRRAAEHLAHTREEVIGIVRDCRRWFDEQELPAPSLYVPPAWAMGAVPRRALDGLGFRYFETLAGIYDTRTQRFLRLPVVGFEADTRLRAVMLRLSNRVNRGLGRRAGAVRLSIHPFDAELRLSADLERCLGEDRPALTVTSLG